MVGLSNFMPKGPETLPKVCTRVWASLALRLVKNTTHFCSGGALMIGSPFISLDQSAAMGL